MPHVVTVALSAAALSGISVQIFVAHGGTYTVEGDTIHLIPTMALNTNIIGVDFAVKVIRLNKRTLVSQGEYPPSNPTTTRELTFRRLK